MKSIPMLNYFNYAKTPLGKLVLEKKYMEKISKLLKSNKEQKFLLGFISKGEGKGFEIIGCSIIPYGY